MSSSLTLALPFEVIVPVTGHIFAAQEAEVCSTCFFARHMVTLIVRFPRLQLAPGASLPQLTPFLLVPAVNQWMKGAFPHSCHYGMPATEL